MSTFAQHLACQRILPSFRWLAAVALLAFFTLASVGSSARVSGEMNAALQVPGARVFAVLLLAAPIVLALRSRPRPTAARATA